MRAPKPVWTPWPPNCNEPMKMARYPIHTALLLASAALLAAATFPTPVFSAAAQTQAPDDFSGFWTRGPAVQSAFEPPDAGPGPVINLTPPPPEQGGGIGGSWIGDHTNPILQPWAAATVREHNDREREDRPFLTAQQLCSPHGVPFILQLNDTVQFLHTRDLFVILYAREMRARFIHMDAEHPPDLEPNYYGHSIGHWEGGTLVVDTIGISDNTWTDRFGTPHTDQIHVVERTRLVDGGNTIRVDFTVEDPGAFTTPWSAFVTYHPEDGIYSEQACAENNRNILTGEDYPIPVDDTPDF